MGADDVHAVLLLATAVVPLLALLLLPRGRPGPSRWLIAALLLLAGFGIRVRHMCLAGDPDTQLWLPALAATVTILFVSSGRAAVGLGALLVAASVFLSSQYLDLVHGRGYTGNPSWPLGFAKAVAAASLERLAEEVRETEAKGPTPLPPGWLDQAPLDWKRAADVPRAHSVVVRERWHTFFTQLWRVERTPLRAWYPGGTPSSAADHLAWREG